MKLFASMLTTGIIACGIWSLVILQPAMAEAPPLTPVTPTLQDIQPPIRSIDNSQQYVRGLTKSILLQSMPILWDEFNQEVVLKNKLPNKLDRIVVLYRHINKDFTEAEVTIGHLVQKSSLANDAIELPPVDNWVLLLSQGEHSEAELTEAWKQINYQKSVESLVEIHYLNEQGKPVSSQLSVYYK